MKQKRFAEEAKIRILREARVGALSVVDLCAKHNIACDAFYRWRRKYGDMDIPEARRLKALEEENRRLKKIVADISIENDILKEVNAKKW